MGHFLDSHTSDLWCPVFLKGGKMKKEKVVFDLLFEGQLKEFLERLEIYDKFINNEMKCEKCESTLTSDNLGFIKIEDKEPKFYCDNPECLRGVS